MKHHEAQQVFNLVAHLLCFIKQYGVQNTKNRTMKENVKVNTKLEEIKDVPQYGKWKLLHSPSALTAEN